MTSEAAKHASAMLASLERHPGLVMEVMAGRMRVLSAAQVAMENENPDSGEYSACLQWWRGAQEDELEEFDACLDSWLERHPDYKRAFEILTKSRTA